jgi:hypothetical protein
MTAPLQAGDEVDAFVQALPAHLRENFEKADRQIVERYGMSPGVTALIRLWLACSTAAQIRCEFEQAVLDIRGLDIEPNAEGRYDDDCL